MTSCASNGQRNDMNKKKLPRAIRPADDHIGDRHRRVCRKGAAGNACPLARSESIERRCRCPADFRSWWRRHRRGSAPPAPSSPARGLCPRKLNECGRRGGAATIAGPRHRGAPCCVFRSRRNHSATDCECGRHHGRYRAHGQSAKRYLPTFHSSATARAPL